MLHGQEPFFKKALGRRRQRKKNDGTLLICQNYPTRKITTRKFTSYKNVSWQNDRGDKFLPIPYFIPLS